MAEALLHRSPGIFFHLGKTAAARVKITVRAVTHLAAEQLIERHAGAFGFDVPEGDVDAAHRIEQHRPIAPIRAHITRLPDILDFVYIAPDQKGLQILLDRRLNDKRTLCKGRAPPTHEAGLRRFDFHDDQPDTIRRCQNGFDISDLHGRCARHSLSVTGITFWRKNVRQ